jgi:hypothetical protein
LQTFTHPEATTPQIIPANLKNVICNWFAKDLATIDASFFSVTAFDIDFFPVENDIFGSLRLLNFDLLKLFMQSKN